MDKLIQKIISGIHKHDIFSGGEGGFMIGEVRVTFPELHKGEARITLANKKYHSVCVCSHCPAMNNCKSWKTIAPLEKRIEDVLVKLMRRNVA